MGIPVLIIQGILESGKSFFIKNSIIRGDFGDLGKILILSQEEGEVERRKQQEVFLRAVFFVGKVFAEGDKACKGGNQRADAADVYAKKEGFPIRRELRKQNC